MAIAALAARVYVLRPCDCLQSDTPPYGSGRQPCRTAGRPNTCGQSHHDLWIDACRYAKVACERITESSARHDGSAAMVPQASDQLGLVLCLKRSDDGPRVRT